MRHRTWSLMGSLAGALALAISLPAASSAAHAQGAPTTALLEPPAAFGPYSAHVLAGGRGLTKRLPAGEPLLAPSAAWTLSAWVQFAPRPAAQAASGQAAGELSIAGVGSPEGVDSRFFVLAGNRLGLRLGPQQTLLAPQSLDLEQMHFMAATGDGSLVRFYVDGVEAAHGNVQAGPVAPQLVLAPVQAACAHLPCPHFGGRIALLALERGVASRQSIAERSRQLPDFSLIQFEEASKPWPLQVVQFAGNTAPQDPATLPHARAPFSKPVAAPMPPAQTTLAAQGPGDWLLRGGWQLAEAPQVAASPEQIATVGFSNQGWLPAVVPGTVLTTLIARGIFPDPDFGLDNLAIPERLNKQDYWYRCEFRLPAGARGDHLSLVLDGINYHAELWLNGKHLGATTGAFVRGVFDLSSSIQTDGQNALAIRISPAPHPGIPNVQSIALGSGLNGGAMALDGPTFMATEGWDWMPPERDRNTGLWQDVHLLATGPVAIGDTQVITHLPLPDTSRADLTLNIPLTNVSAQPVHGTLRATFEGASLQKELTLPPGKTTVHFGPGEYAQLHLAHPRLWWPNGYGRPELYHLRTTFSSNGIVSSDTSLRFGVREVSYELSLLDNSGALRRVDYDPTLGRDAPAPQVDVTHEAMRQVPDGWAASIAAGAEDDRSFRAVADTRATPYLILRVNGVRIAVRGGSWGMDDARKRVSREHLEPFFRLDRDANLNIIRNWQGQDTEETFYQLADEYGLMVWNDFWEVTTDSNAEAEDPQLFLKNAADTILRYRNHPSIVMWCGRNEGVPQPVINKGLIALTHTLDGTRYYSPSSNQVNLQTSGPYSYEDPADYYGKLDPGFAVEVGTPSLPDLEWFTRWLPKQDWWPISDDWAYHNWHPHDAFNRHLEAQFGAADNLVDYERKAQLMNYVDYRAIFEGFNAHLWAPNGGRLLWMTQPAWPSTLWGILSSDYDTHASFYGTRKACEPVHVQLNLASDEVSVVNTTTAGLRGLKVTVDVSTLANTLLLHREAVVEAAADDVTRALAFDMAPLLEHGVVFVRLSLHAAGGELLSTNLYWLAAHETDYRALNTLAAATVAIDAQPAAQSAAQSAAGQQISVRLRNQGKVAALNLKLVTSYARDGTQVLPAYYSDNYVSLLPGEESHITIDLPEAARGKQLQLQLRGWNLPAATTELQAR